MTKAINLVITSTVIFSILMPIFVRDARAEIDRLDTTFNSVGYATHNGAAGGVGTDRGNSIAIQPDGKYVIAGNSRNAAANDDMAIWRYNSDGSLDTTFNSVGYAVHNSAAGGNSHDLGQSISIQSDGKYVVAGYSRNVAANNDMVIWRYNTNGSLDTTFNSVGYVVHNNAAGGNSHDLGQSISIQSDGKYVVAGYSRNVAANDDMAIWRYNTDGTLDTTFNSVGYATHHNAAGGNGSDVGSLIAIQSDGKYVITGYSLSAATNTDMVIWRYNSDGSLDTTFNSVGYAVHAGAAGGSAADAGNSIAVQAEGKYVVTGYSTNAAADQDMVIWRYNTDGSLDTTFNSVGYTVHNSAAGGIGSDIGSLIVIQVDGKCVVSGYSTNAAANHDMAIWRYNSDGSLDTTFNSVGYFIHNSAAGGNGADRAYSSVIQSDGKYVAAGYSRNGAGNDDMALWRYEVLYQIDTIGLDPEAGGLIIQQGGASGDAGEDVEVSLTKNNKMLAQANVDMWHDLDWTGVTGDLSTVSYKSFINGLSTADGVDGLITLYVPYRAGDNRVGICPSATTLAGVNENCTGLLEKEESDADTEIVTIDSIRYWKVSGLAGTGGYSYYQEGLADTGDSIYLFTGGLLFHLI
jgi:uncharacterized delta-60 repeat protein